MFETLKKNSKGISLIFACSIFVCVGQLVWKIYGYSNIIPVIIGFLIYGIGMLLMLIAFKYGEMSVLQPMLSVNYAIALILGYFFLGEEINIYRVIGVILILIGVIRLGGSSSD